MVTASGKTRTKTGTFFTVYYRTGIRSTESKMYNYKLKTVKVFSLITVSLIKRFIFQQNFTSSLQQSLTQADSD